MFEKFNFSDKQIEKYYKSAWRDFKIAADSDVPEIIFKFSYDALLKLSMVIVAKNNLRIKSRQGHHVELINKASIFLKNEDLDIIGQKMRSKRNKDLYSGGVLISQKEAQEIFKWVKKIFDEGNEYLFKRKKMI